MDYRYLDAFIAVAETQNFTKAGEKLSVAQSAISRQIKLLEASLGQQLLIRSPQKVLLTPSGHRLFEQTRHYHQWIQNQFHQERPTIRIATMPGVLENWLTSKLNGMDGKALPNLDIQTGSPQFIAESLLNNKADIGFSSRPMENEILSSRRIFTEEFVLIGKSKPSLSKLHEYCWIYADQGNYLRRSSKKVSSRFIRVTSISSLLNLAEAGQGIAIVASHMVHSKLKVTKTPLPKLKGSIYLGTLNYQRIPEHLGQFIKKLKI